MGKWERNDNWCTVDAVIVHDSGKAFRIEVDEEVQTWIPKSQMKFVANVQLAQHDSPDSVQTLVIKEWIAIKNGVDKYCEPYVADTADQYDDNPDDVPF